MTLVPALPRLRALASKPIAVLLVVGQAVVASGCFLSHTGCMPVDPLGGPPRSGSTGFVVTRLCANGMMDTSFGSGGWVTWSELEGGPAGFDGYAVATDHEGYILAYSELRPDDPTPNRGRFALLDPAGERVGSFGEDGILEAEFVGESARLGSAALDFERSIGFVYATRLAFGETSSRVGVMVLGRDGVVSRTALLLPPATGGTLRSVLALVAHPTGIYVSGAQDGADRGWVMRLLVDGTLDTSFGDGGVASVRDQVQEMHVDSRGGVVVRGEEQLARLLPSGEPDTSYGEGGVAPAVSPPGYPFDFFWNSGMAANAEDWTFHPIGYIIGGPIPFTDAEVTHRFRRFRSDGLPAADAIWSVVYGPDDDLDMNFTQLAFDPLGNLVAAAMMIRPSERCVFTAVLRLRQNSSLDSDFGGTDLPGFFHLEGHRLRFESMAIDPSSRIVLGGHALIRSDGGAAFGTTGVCG